MKFLAERSSVKTKFILHLINKFSDRLLGYFTTIGEAKIRFRKLKQF